MEYCYGGHSAHLCQACLKLKRQRNWRRPEKVWHKTKNINQAKGSQSMNNNTNKLPGIEGVASPKAPSQYRRQAANKSDEENDAELAMLAAEHLFFSTSDDRLRRENARDAFEMRWCALCFLSFRSMQERDNHIKQNPIKHITCPFCCDPTIYPTRHALAEQHDCTDRIACRYCAILSWWPNRATRRVHMIREHSMCMVCDEGEQVVFSDKEALRKHKRLEHGTVYCTWCDMIFEHEVAKYMHMEFKHPSCHDCGVFFKELAEQLRHFTVFCHFCNLAFGSPGDKQRHMQNQHGDECEDCAFCTHSGEKHCHVHSTTDRPERPVAPSPTPPPPPPLPEPQPSEDREPDLYAILHVTPSSSTEEIVKAARKRRIETHPDRLLRRADLSAEGKEVIREQAKCVGFAADILCDVLKKREYDRKMNAAARKQRWGRRFGAGDPFE